MFLTRYVIDFLLVYLFPVNCPLHHLGANLKLLNKLIQVKTYTCRFYLLFYFFFADALHSLLLEEEIGFFCQQPKKRLSFT